MPIDWNSFNDDIDTAVAQSGTRTDDQLASKISSVTRLTDDEIKQMFPDPADVKKLAALMQIVKSATDKNAKVNQLVANSETFASIIIPLLEKFA